MSEDLIEPNSKEMTEEERERELEAYIASKYFPPMYDAEEVELAPLAAALDSTKIKKIQFDPEKEDNIFVLEDVLSKSECDWLIERSEKLGYEQSTVYSAEEDNNIVRKDIRDNHRVLENFPIFAQKLWECVAPFFPDEIDGKKKAGLYHLFRYYRYHPGQNFAPHPDHTVFDEHDEDCQSRFTFLIYLNEDYVGGNTRFTELKATPTDGKIIPKIGSVATFRHENFHEGMRVESGVKYAVRTDVMYK